MVVLLFSPSTESNVTGFELGTLIFFAPCPKKFPEADPVINFSFLSHVAKVSNDFISLEIKKEAMSLGMQSLRQSGIEKLLKGEINYDEVLKTTVRDDD